MIGKTSLREASIVKRLVAFFLIFSLVKIAFAVPTLQVYGVNSVAYDGPGDEDSWLLNQVTGSVELIGTYSSNTVSITNAFLLITTDATAGNPLGAGYTKYDDITAFEATLAGFDPDVNLNHHAPLGNDASVVDVFAFDLSLLGMDSFGMVGPTKDCNADVPGATECAAAPNSVGEIHTFNYDFKDTGIQWAHFDLVAYITDETGNGKWVSNYWEINPGSHDSTFRVPEPAPLALFALGLLAIGFARKAKF